MKPTERTTRELRDNVEKSLQLLRTLRDEIRVEAHLAGMEAKKRWEEELEPLLGKAERSVADVAANARHNVNDTLARWRAFYEELTLDPKEARRVRRATDGAPPPRA